MGREARRGGAIHPAAAQEERLRHGRHLDAEGLEEVLEVDVLPVRPADLRHASEVQRVP